jgi:hypothetical protein
MQAFADQVAIAGEQIDVIAIAVGQREGLLCASQAGEVHWPSAIGVQPVRQFVERPRKILPYRRAFFAALRDHRQHRRRQRQPGTDPFGRDGQGFQVALPGRVGMTEFEQNAAQPFEDLGVFRLRLE